MTVKFNLETPTGNRLDPISRFSGWYIPDHGCRPQLYVACNGEREAALEWGSIRPDVSSVYSVQSQAIISGFQGDLLVGEHVQGQEVDIAVLDAAGQDRELFRRTYVLGPTDICRAPPHPRPLCPPPAPAHARPPTNRLETH